MEHDDDIGCNPTDNPSLADVASLSRRQVLQGTLGAAAVAFIGGPRQLFAQAASRMGFASVSASQEDGVRLPPGYTHQVVHAWGTPSRVARDGIRGPRPPRTTRPGRWACTTTGCTSSRCRRARTAPAAACWP